MGRICRCASRSLFDRDDRHLIARITAVLSAAVHRIDRDRLLGVRDRIDRKMMEQIHPKDLFYQILDGIRSLTLYDHSSALLIREENEASLRVVAEQIAWTKAKSERIGLRIPITDDAAALLQSAHVYGFTVMGTAGESGGISRRAVLPPCSITTPRRRRRRKQPRSVDAVRSTGHAGQPRGVLKIAARYPEQLKPFDAELVEHFRRKRRSPSRTCTARSRCAPVS